MEDIRQNGRILSDAIQHITQNAVKGSGLFSKNSIILATTATIGEHAMLIVDSLANQQFTNFKIRKSLASKLLPEFVFYRFFKIDEWAKKNTNAGGLLSVDIEGLKRLQFPIPSISEQKKIANFLSLLDERIATQKKIIEDLKKLKSALNEQLLNKFCRGVKRFRLGDICKIVTGKLDANAMIENGKYPFFTCAEIPSSIDSYAFDTEALLISGNGANVGYINYYSGKFNAYQRTYVLDRFTENIQFIRLWLNIHLPKRIAIEKSTSNTPYIVMSTLSDMQISLPDNCVQKRISETLNSFESKLSLETKVLLKFTQLKQYLLSQMLI